MALFICEFEGVRGRNLKLYDTKVIITTKKTVGSLITGNFTDGEKTIYLRDVVGVQFKKSGGLIGYLQFETPSMQMNNKNDNMFSENTFTYEADKNGITNELMTALYNFVTDRIEELKYSTSIINKTPDFEAMKIYKYKSEEEKNESLDEEIPENEPENEYEVTTDYESTDNGNKVNDPTFGDGKNGTIAVTTGDGQPLETGDYTPVYINRKGVVKTLLKYIETKEGGTTAKVPAINRPLVSLAEEGSELLPIDKRTSRIADDVEIEGGTTKTFALILYIRENKDDQTDTDAKKTFSGQVTVSSGDGKTGVSGSIGLVTEEVENQLQSNQQNTQQNNPTGDQSDPSGTE